MNYAGIDVSKETLHVAVIAPPWKAEFPNTAAGHRRLCKRLLRFGEPIRVVLEATASYGEGITHSLNACDSIEVMVANPRATKSFAKALDQRGKTDAIDSMMLARFAVAMPFKTWTAPSNVARRLRKLMRRRLQLVHQAAAEKVRLKEIRCETSPDGFVIEDIQDHIHQLDRRTKRFEQKALEFIRADQELDAWRVQLCTIPGVADVTALAIISELACVALDMDARQLVAYAGLDPKPFQSGSMDATRRISKRGNKRLRTTMYLAAWNVTRFSPEVAAWRKRLTDAGKKPKLADIAVARKLLHAIDGMRRTGTNWDGTKFSGGGAHG
jgi:transposase